MFKIKSEKNLPVTCCTKYSGMTFDGCWFYITQNSENKVIQFNEDFQQERTFDTCRSYNLICYDSKDKCFWATCDKFTNKIFKLDKCFKEISDICVNIPECANEPITGLSYNCCDDVLLISLTTCVISISKKNPRNINILKKYCKEWIMGVLSICPFYICYFFSPKKQFIRIFTAAGKLIKEFPIPCNINIKSAVFYPCNEKCNSCIFYALVSKDNCNPYILECKLEYNELCEKLCECNYVICPPPPKPEPEENCCEQSYCDILESIAFMETSLSHILNAEGEKLQKVIASTDDINKILAVNNAINKTIINATHLEHVLYEKLESLNNCCNKCCDLDELECEICKPKCKPAEKVCPKPEKTIKDENVGDLFNKLVKNEICHLINTPDDDHQVNSPIEETSKEHQCDCENNK